MTLATNLGFPRIGADRELKKAVEGYWRGSVPRAELLQTARGLRRRHWLQQHRAGLASVPSNDFSLYDQVLDACALVGAVPPRFGAPGDAVDLDPYFRMARGAATSRGDESDVAPMEMTKWFDTNYHYIVPELESGRPFRLASTKPEDELAEAKALGLASRPVLIGPVTFLLLAKRPDGGRPLELLDGLLPVYAELLRRLEAGGAEWVQLDEPMLARDLGEAEREAYRSAYRALSAASGAKLLVATYFGGLRDNLATAVSLPVDALHVDLAREPGELDALLDALPESMSLSAGVVDGRNVWRNDLDASLALLRRAASRIGSERLWVAPSCSLLHVPVDVERETELDPEIRGWLAFAAQKLDEVAALARGVDEGDAALRDALAASREALRSRRESARIHRSEVKARSEAVGAEDARRRRPYRERREVQGRALGLPLLPTTTIGSFPQTAETRRKRAARRKGRIGEEAYREHLAAETRRTVRTQEALGLDLLVHGEAERSDMVEYFGEQLTGYAFTRRGWVQSFGSRCVRPPLLYGDVARPAPMTVGWSTYAQSLTERPVKGMLTGPVTLLQWSYVRDDQPRPETARQIALAIRDEVADLEAAGMRAIQIDEPALREGLPLRREDWDPYLEWAVECFRLASGGASDGTQIHTHMCYAEFNDIIEAIADLDADVISIEASRSRMDLLEAFADFAYPNGIGPGVYDIHSPRIPSEEEMADLIRKALERLDPGQLWVNPDCGLKTRSWEEVNAALGNMVRAAAAVRRERAR